MKNYTKTYMKFFGYTIADWMPCELPGCGQRAVDIHHIHARSRRKDLENNIVNLIGLCREHHAEHGDKKDKLEWLQEVHNDFMAKNKKK